MSRIFIIWCLIFSFSLIFHSEGAPTAKIKKDASVSNGSEQVILSAGTTVQVLSVSGDHAVINCTAADGSAFITQVAVTVLDFPSPPTTPATNSTPDVTSLSTQSSTASAVFTSPAPPASGENSASAPLDFADASQRTLEESLVLAGDNRPELQNFLDSHPSPEAAFLIRKARQSDLVNLTDQLLSDDLASVEKAKANARWADRIPPEIWQEFVLPYRVADEPLDDFKPEFYDKLAPIVASAEESGEAALLVHHWYWHQNDGTERVSFKVTESRDQPPRMFLNQTKIGRCFEMNLLCVALLRSVGIPARIAGISYWMNDDFYHYWVEYYDTKTNSWLYFEGSDPNVDSMKAKSPLRKGNRAYPTVYALPGFCPIADPIEKERWDTLINTSPLYLSCGTIHFEVNPGVGQSPPVFTAYCWNLNAWRSVAQVTGNGQGQADITIAANDHNYPYLVSTAVGGVLYWQMVKVVANNSTDITDSTIDMRPMAKVVPVAPSKNIPKEEPTGEL